MKKRIVALVLIVTMVASLFIGCDNSINETEQFANVRFSSSEVQSKGLNSVLPQFDSAKLFWKYTAKKIDASNLKTGETSVPKPVGADGKLTNPVGPFSLGEWEFTLYAYNSSTDTEPVYQGSKSNVLISNEGNNQVSIKVNALQNHHGYVDIADDIVLKDSFGNPVKNYNEVITFSRSEKPDEAVELEHVGRHYIVPSGSWKISISYQSKTQPVFEYGQNTIYVAVFDNQTIRIEGSLEEITTDVVFDVTVDGGQNVVYTPKEPIVHTQDNSYTVPTTSETSNPEKEVKVDIPAGSLKQGGKVELDVTSYDAVASNQNFVFEVKTGVIGSIDINLKVADQAVTEFDKPVTITTFVGKNLPDTVTVKYNGGGADMQPTTKNYDPVTGMITFETSHFSQFYIVAEGAVVLNTKTGQYYVSLADALQDSTPSSDKIDPIIIFGDSVIDSDIILDNKNINLNLGGKSMILNDHHVRLNNSRLVVNNGTVTGNSKLFDLNGSELILESGNYTQTGNGNEYMFTIDPAGVSSSVITAVSGDFDGSTSKGIFHSELTDSSDNYLKIVGGNFKGLLALWEGNGIVEIKNGNFSNDDTVLYQKQGKLELMGGTFNAGTGNGNWAHVDDGVVLNGSAIVLEGSGNLSANIIDYAQITVAQPLGGDYCSYEILVIDWSSADGAPCAHPVDRTGILRPYQYARVEGHAASNDVDVPSDGYYSFNDGNTRTFDIDSPKSVYIDFSDFGDTFRTGGTYVSVMFDGHKVLTTKDRFSENGDVAVSRLIDSLVANNSVSAGSNAHQHGYSVEKVTDNILMVSNPNGIEADNWSLIGLGGHGTSVSAEYPICQTLSNDTVLTLTIDDRIIPETHEDLYYSDYYKVIFNGEVIDAHRGYTRDAVVYENLFSRGKNVDIVVEAYNMNDNLLGRTEMTVPVDESFHVDANVILNECTESTGSFCFKVSDFDFEPYYYLDGVRYEMEQGDHRTNYRNVIEQTGIVPGMHSLKLTADNSENRQELTYDFEVKSNVPLNSTFQRWSYYDKGKEIYMLREFKNKMEIEVTCMNNNGVVYPGSDLIFDIKLKNENNHQDWTSVNAYIDDYWHSFRKGDDGLYRLHLPQELKGMHDVVISVSNNYDSSYAEAIVPINIENVEIDFPYYGLTINGNDYYGSNLNVGSQYVFKAVESPSTGKTPCSIQWYVDGKPVGQPNDELITVELNEVGVHRIGYRLNAVYHPDVYCDRVENYSVCYLAAVTNTEMQPGAYFTPEFHWLSKETHDLNNRSEMELRVNGKATIRTYGDSFYIPNTIPVGEELECDLYIWGTDYVSIFPFSVTTVQAESVEQLEFSVNGRKQEYAESIVIEIDNQDSFPGYDFTFFIDGREWNAYPEEYGNERNRYYLNVDLLTTGKHSMTVKGVKVEADEQVKTVERTKDINIEEIVPNFKIGALGTKDGLPNSYIVYTGSNRSLDEYTLTWYRNTPNGYVECGSGSVLLIPEDRYEEFKDVKVVVEKPGTDIHVEETYTEVVKSYLGGGNHYFTTEHVEKRLPYEVSLEVLLDGKHFSELPKEEQDKYTFTWYCEDRMIDARFTHEVECSNTPILSLTFKNLDENYRVDRIYYCNFRYDTGEVDYWGNHIYDYSSGRSIGAQCKLEFNPNENVDFVKADRVYYTFDNTEALANDHASAYIGTLVLDDENNLFTYDYAMIGTHLVDANAEGGAPAPAMLDTLPSSVVMLDTPFVAPATVSSEQGNAPGKAPQLMYDIMNLKGGFRTLSNGNIELSYTDGQGRSQTEIVYIKGKDAKLFDTKLTLLTGKQAPDMGHLGTWRLPSVKLSEATLDEVVNEWVNPMVSMYVPIKEFKAIGFEGSNGIDANADLRFEKDLLRLALGVDLRANLINSGIKLGEPFNIGGESCFPYRVYGTDNDLKIWNGELPIKFNISPNGDVMVVKAAILAGPNMVVRFTFPLVRIEDTEMQKIAIEGAFPTDKRLELEDAGCMMSDIINEVELDDPLSKMLAGKYNLADAKVKLDGIEVTNLEEKQKLTNSVDFNGLWTVANPEKYPYYLHDAAFINSFGVTGDGSVVTLVTEYDGYDQVIGSHWELNYSNYRTSVLELKNFELEYVTGQNGSELNAVTYDVVTKEKGGFLNRYAGVRSVRTTASIEETVKHISDLRTAGFIPTLSFNTKGEIVASIPGESMEIKVGKYGVDQDRICMGVDIFSIMQSHYTNVESMVYVTLGYKEPVDPSGKAMVQLFTGYTGRSMGIHFSDV